MKILKIVHGFLPECNGGTERHVLQLSRELVAQGHEVHILCGSQQGAGPVAADANLVHGSYEGLPVHRLHRPGLFLDNWEKSLAPEVEPLFDWLMRDIRPDLVHVHHWIRLTRNLVELAHDRGVPAVVTLHDLWTTCPKAFRIREGSFCNLEMGPVNCIGCAPAGENMSDEEQRRELALFRDDIRNELDLARRIIVPSVAHREVLLKHMPQTAGRFRVLPHGNISEVRRRKPTRSSFPSGPLRIGHWGHLSHLKGFDILLSAVRESRHRNDIELHVFGEMVYPSERAHFEQLAEGLAITWHGQYTPTDLAKVPLDLAVITSRCSESWSFVLDEAFQLGLPAVVPDRGALKERIGGAGTTFLAESSPDLAAAFGEIFRNPRLLELWRSRIPELPGLHDHARRMVAVYREVLSSEAPLPVTKQTLRNRRLLQRSWQLETRNRRLELEQGDLRNALDDLARAGKTMDEMQYYHGEKDKELSRLSREVTQLREESIKTRDAAAKAAADEIGRRVHDLEKKERKKQRRVERLKEEMEDATATSVRLATELAAAEDRADALLIEIAAAEQKAERSEADAEVLRKALSEQESAVMALHAEATRTLERLQDAQTDRNKAVAALSRNTAEMLEHGALDATQGEVNEPLPPLLQRLQDLIESIAQHDAAVDVPALRAHNAMLLARTQALEHLCKTTVQAHHGERTAADSLRSDVATTSAALAGAAAELATLRHVESAAKEAAKDSSQKAQRLESLGAELSVESARADALRAELAAQAAVLAEQKARLAAQRTELETLHTEATAASAAHELALSATRAELNRLVEETSRAAKSHHHELGTTRAALQQESANAGELHTLLESERGRMRVLESHAQLLRDHVRGLGLQLLEQIPEAVTDDSEPAELALEKLIGTLLRRQASAQALLGERDRLIAHFAKAIDSLTTMIDADERRRSMANAPARMPGKRLKVLQVIHQFLPRHVAGTELYTAALSKELARRNDVVLLTAESDHSKPRFERTVTEINGLKVHQFIHNYQWSGFRDTYDCSEADDIFRDVLRLEQPDVVHLQHLHYHSANYVTIARALGIPVVYTLHDYGALCARDGQLRRADGEICSQAVPSKCRDCIAHHVLEQRSVPLLPRALRPGADSLVPQDLALIVRRARMQVHSDDPHELAVAERLDYLRRVLADINLAIAPSAFLRDTVVASGLIPADRIIVSDNGYDLTQWQNIRREPGSGLRISFIGTIAEHKGVHTLIRAMNAVPDEGISCRIFGDLSAFTEYSESLRLLNTNPRTLLMGALPHEHVRTVLAQTDLLVIPSLWPENSPLTVHEAALAGVPVLASGIGGLAEYVRDGVTGLHFAVGDAEALRSRIHEFAARGLPGFNPGALAVKSIQADATAMEARYRELIAREASARRHN